MSRDLPMTVSHLNANLTSHSETTQANTTEPIPSNETENLGMADGHFRRNLPSTKTENTAISTGPSNNWFVVFGLNDPLRQYFSLYRVVSQREGERGE